MYTFSDNTCNSYNNDNLTLLAIITINNYGLVLLVLKLVMGFMQFKGMFRKSWKDLLNMST